ncbi:MAG: hypothetical protein K8R60_04435 [Burkholderiales bacterium]|nr:hypothetical protein [Burkholderiales bacterium]
MDVAVVRLRRQGVKLSAEEVRAAVPVRGCLGVVSRLGRGPSDLVIVATLTTEQQTYPTLLPSLDHARLTRLRGHDLVIAGIEEVELSRRRIQTFAQSWWCRLLGSPSTSERERLRGWLPQAVSID